MVILSLPFNTIYAQTTGSIEGVIRDEVADEGLPFISIKLLQDGLLIAGTDSDFDGNYSINNIEAGTYDIELSYIGFPITTYQSVTIQIGRVHSIDLELPNPLIEETEEKDSITIVYREPIIKPNDDATGRRILSAEDIDRMTTRDIAAVQAMNVSVNQSKKRRKKRKTKKRNKSN